MGGIGESGGRGGECWSEESAEGRSLFVNNGEISCGYTSTYLLQHQEVMLMPASWPCQV